jgi:hypothetical protein
MEHAQYPGAPRNIFSNVFSKALKNEYFSPNISLWQIIAATRQGKFTCPLRNFLLRKTLRNPMTNRRSQRQPITR